MDFINLFRTFHSNAEEYTFFLSAHGTFSRIVHILSHKSYLSKFKKIDIVSSIFSDHNIPTLCDPIDGSPPGSTAPGIFQARTLEWVAIPFSSAGKLKVKVKSLSRIRLLATPWTAAYQAPPSMGFSRQEYWSGVPLSSPQHYETRCQLQEKNCKKHKLMEIKRHISK